MTILITGANGFLGSHLVNYLSDKYNVIALIRENSNTKRLDVINKKFTLTTTSQILNNPLEFSKIDIIINTITCYGRKNESLQDILDSNVLFPLKLLEKSIKNDILCFINTDTMLKKSTNKYSLSKKHFVEWMKLFSKTSHVKFVNIKIEHMYGINDDKNKFVFWLLENLKQNAPYINLTKGTQKRDFIYIDDVLSAYETIIKNISKIKNGFNEFELGSGKSIHVRTFIEKFYKYFKTKQQTTTTLNFGAIKYKKNEANDILIDTSKLNKLGWMAKVSIDGGIKKIIDSEIN